MTFAIVGTSSDSVDAGKARDAVIAAAADSNSSLRAAYQISSASTPTAQGTDPCAAVTCASGQVVTYNSKWDVDFDVMSDDD